MAHIRQILANLSISVSDFKKNPKTVVKAVKNEPIAVIINDKPAFYCVPADILESLYQKFYEMNDMTLQNIQELSTSEAQTVPNDNINDDCFGVNDIFQAIETPDTPPKIANTEALIDPISNNVADPLDEEVANQITNSIDNNLLDSAKKIVAMNTDLKSQFGNLENLNDNTNLHNVGDLGDLDKDILNSPNLSTSLNQGNNLFNGNNSFADSDQISSRSSVFEENTEELLTDNDLLNQDPMMTTSSEVKKLEDKAALCEVLKDASQEFRDSKKANSLVSGPHSFTLEHVAKTYSPYQDKHTNHKNDLKKEQKLLKKEIKEAKRLAKEAKRLAKASKIKQAKATKEFMKKSLVTRNELKNVIISNMDPLSNIDTKKTKESLGNETKVANSEQKKVAVNQIFSHMIHNPPKINKVKEPKKEVNLQDQLKRQEQEQKLQNSLDLVNSTHEILTNIKNTDVQITNANEHEDKTKVKRKSKKTEDSQTKTILKDKETTPKKVSSKTDKKSLSKSKVPEITETKITEETKEISPKTKKIPSRKAKSTEEKSTPTNKVKEAEDSEKKE